MTSVVFVNRAGRVSGAETILLKLIGIAVEREYRIRVVSPPGALLDRLPAGIEHFPIDELDLGGRSGLARVGAMFGVLGRYRRAAAAIRRAADPDSIVIVNSTMALPAARLARLKSGVRWLAHDTINDGTQRLVIRIGAKSVRRTIAVSPPTADSIRDLGLPVDVSPMGIDIPPRRDSDVRSEPPIVGIMGLLTGWKGHRVLLEAMAKIPQAHCEIAGNAFHADQDYADELREIAAQPALAGRVDFLGHVDPISTISRWDVLVSASTSPEAGPIVALEAMGVGVPVVATDHGGSTWLLRDGAGVLVPPDDASALAAGIEYVLSGPAELPGMVEKARARVVAEHDAKATFPAMLDALVAR